MRPPHPHARCSREVYHTKRMQRVFATRFSADGRYVFSGSDDMNLRVWKAVAAAPTGVLLPREKHKLAYDRALVARYRHLPDVGRVERSRPVPTPIKRAAALRRAQTDAEARKTRRRVAHSAPGSVEVKPERRKKVLREEE